MKVVCAWCGKVLRAGDDKRVSHGICSVCKVALDPQEPSDPGGDHNSRTAKRPKSSDSS